MSKLHVRPGVLTGKALRDVLDYCKEAQCALPAVNVIGSHSTNAALEAARRASSPVIIQVSNGGARFWGGKWLDNTDQAGAVAGAVACAHYCRVMAEHYGVAVILHSDHAAKKLIPWVEGMVAAGEAYYAKHGEPLYSSHMLDLSEEPLEENLQLSADMLTRMAKIDMTLEIELGVTGGEEDGVDNSDIDDSRLYTQPSEVLAAYDKLNPIGSFMVAASFGNTHGVYKPGNVILRPKILKDSQEVIAAERSTDAQPLDAKPLHFVFHGGSGSAPEEIAEAVSYGVVKMNIDTDTQWAFTNPIKQYMDTNDGYLHTQIGNPEGADKPNKKKIDPRGWIHTGEQGMADRLVQAFKDLGAFGKFNVG